MLDLRPPAREGVGRESPGTQQPKEPTMYVADMSVKEAREWLKHAEREGLTKDDIQDLKELIAGRSVQR